MFTLSKQSTFCDVPAGNDNNNKENNGRGGAAEAPAGVGSAPLAESDGDERSDPVSKARRGVSFMEQPDPLLTLS
eukprot:8774902-Pyramimonas_sp.AAC.1